MDPIILATEIKDHHFKFVEFLQTRVETISVEDYFNMFKALKDYTNLVHDLLPQNIILHHCDELVKFDRANQSLVKITKQLFIGNEELEENFEAYHEKQLGRFIRRNTKNEDVSLNFREFANIRLTPPVVFASNQAIRKRNSWLKTTHKTLGFVSFCFKNWDQKEERVTFQTV
jgi:hypothetical protein